MRFSISLIFALITSQLISQVTLTSDVIPQDGDSYSVYALINPTSPSFLADNGANAYWDFSSFNHTAGSLIDFATLTSADFPESNMRYYLDGYLHVMNISDSLITYFGFDHQLSKMDYLDGVTNLELPFSMGDTFSDTFIGVSLQSGNTYDFEGVRHSSADSWGTLEVPGMVYENTLRILQVDTTIMILDGLNITYIDSSYLWYSNNFHYPILEFTTQFTADGINMGSTGRFLSQENLSISDSEKELVHIYPNPAKETITLQSKNTGCSIIIYNSHGEMVLSNILKYSKQKLDISSLPKGIYFYELRASNASLLKREKLIVQ